MRVYIFLCLCTYLCILYIIIITLHSHVNTIIIIIVTVYLLLCKQSNGKKTHMYIRFMIARLTPYRTEEISSSDSSNLSLDIKPLLDCLIYRYYVGI